MADWQDRAQMTDDVAFFRYTTPGIEKAAEEVFIWDLDKTYLDTSIDSLTALLVTALERAFNKKNVPGTKALLQALARISSQKKNQARLPLYFISASPPQMEERIAEKFTIDGVRPYGCFYKDNLRNLTPSRFWRLKKQVGYKVQALLQLRVFLKSDVRQICWGDDSESDAVIYNLYSDICARRIGVNDLRSVLKYLAVTNEQIDTIILLQSQIPENDPVEKVYINLAVDTDPDYYLKFGRRTLPTYNTYQVALDLCQDGRLDFEGLYSVAQDMIFNYKFTPEELQRSFEELVRRHILGENFCQVLLPQLKDKGLIPNNYKLPYTPHKEKTVVDGHVFELEGHFEPWVPPRIDYIHDYR